MCILAFPYSFILLFSPTTIRLSLIASTFSCVFSAILSLSGIFILPAFCFFKVPACVSLLLFSIGVGRSPVDDVLGFLFFAILAGWLIAIQFLYILLSRNLRFILSSSAGFNFLLQIAFFLFCKSERFPLWGSQLLFVILWCQLFHFFSHLFQSKVWPKSKTAFIKILLFPPALSDNIGLHSNKKGFLVISVTVAEFPTANVIVGSPRLRARLLTTFMQCMKYIEFITSKCKISKAFERGFE